MGSMRSFAKSERLARSPVGDRSEPVAQVLHVPEARAGIAQGIRERRGIEDLDVAAASRMISMDSDSNSAKAPIGIRISSLYNWPYRRLLFVDHCPVRRTILFTTTGLRPRLGTSISTERYRFTALGVRIRTWTRLT